MVSHEFGPQFHSAARCVMYLRWVESRMRDFLLLKAAAKGGNKRVIELYNNMRQDESSLKVYGAVMAKLARTDLRPLIKMFHKEWPTYKTDPEISQAFTVIEIHRNAFAHCYIPVAGTAFCSFLASGPRPSFAAPDSTLTTRTAARWPPVRVAAPLPPRTVLDQLL